MSEWGKELFIPKSGREYSQIRIFKGEQETFREVYFSEGVRDSRRKKVHTHTTTREIIRKSTKKVRNPRCVLSFFRSFYHIFLCFFFLNNLCSLLHGHTTPLHNLSYWDTDRKIRFGQLIRLDVIWHSFW